MTEETAVIVLRAWAEIEEKLAMIAKPSASGTGQVYQSAIAVLARSGRFNDLAIEELEKLYRTRNNLVHARRDISSGEAELIVGRALYLNALLQVFLTEEAGDSELQGTSIKSVADHGNQTREDLEADYVPIDIGEVSFVGPSSRPIVPDGKTAELPFPLMSWEDFENLIVALAAEVDDLIDVRRYGSSGQRQDGIDIVGLFGSAVKLRRINVRMSVTSQRRSFLKPLLNS